MNTEYEYNYLPWKSLARWVLSLGVNPRNPLAKSPGVLKFGPSAFSPSTRLSTRWADARTTSGSQTSLCPTAQDGAFCVKAPLFGLQEKWDFPSSATSVLGTYHDPHPAQPVCSSLEGTENAKSAPIKAILSPPAPKPRARFSCG